MAITGMAAILAWHCIHPTLGQCGIHAVYRTSVRVAIQRISSLLKRLLSLFLWILLKGQALADHISGL